MFRGLTATFTREMPGYFCFFFAYEACRGVLAGPGQSKDDIGPLKTVISGGMAGVTLWTVIFPADVVKSRLQVRSSVNIREQPQYKLCFQVTGATTPMLVMMKQIYKQEGILALYNGLGPTVIRTFPATGALFLAYEYSKKWMHSVVD